MNEIALSKYWIQVDENTFIIKRRKSSGVALLAGGCVLLAVVSYYGPVLYKALGPVDHFDPLLCILGIIIGGLILGPILLGLWPFIHPKLFLFDKQTQQWLLNCRTKGTLADIQAVSAKYSYFNFQWGMRLNILSLRLRDNRVIALDYWMPNPAETIEIGSHLSSFLSQPFQKVIFDSDL